MSQAEIKDTGLTAIRSCDYCCLVVYVCGDKVQSTKSHSSEADLPWHRVRLVTQPEVEADIFDLCPDCMDNLRRHARHQYPAAALTTFVKDHLRESKEKERKRQKRGKR